SLRRMRLARRTLLGAAAALPALLSGGRARAATDRFVWLQNAAGEEVVGTYRSGEEHDLAAMARIRRLLRDRGAELEGPLPPLLVDMLSALQEQWEFSRPILVRSAYRTPWTNARIEGAAPASLHLRGMAVDIAVPGMPLEDLSGRAWLLGHRLGFMGIGLYSGFVHLDIGPHRVWTRLR
uniref:YcbK family protein n=1 Tax=Falsiroseomonas oryzae TaxID=2766473 RepID=UPI0022EA2E6D